MPQTETRFQDQPTDWYEGHEQQDYHSGPVGVRPPSQDQVLGGLHENYQHTTEQVYVAPDSPLFLRARRLAELRFYFMKLALWWLGLSALCYLVNRQLYPDVLWAHWPAGIWLIMLVNPFIKAYLFRGEELNTIINRRLDAVAMRSAAHWQTHEEIS